jgi:copper chaperone
MGELLKTRHLKVENYTCIGCAAALSESLSKLPGVKKVRSDQLTGEVEVTYDLMEVELSDIEKTLQETGFPVKQSLVSRLKRNLIHFTEDNERDNQNAPPPSFFTMFGDTWNRL